jgi:hypothetical protein
MQLEFVARMTMICALHTISAIAETSYFPDCTNSVYFAVTLPI